MKILYFAWLRERLNRGEEDVIAACPQVITVGDLIGWLRQRDEAADLAMQKPRASSRPPSTPRSSTMTRPHQRREGDRPLPAHDRRLR
jgi:molybdopterin converting factor small subunit